MTRKVTCLAGILALGAPIVLAGCDKKDESTGTTATVASSVAPSTPPPTAKVVKYTLLLDGKTHIDMPGVTEHIKADTVGSAGDLQIDLMNLANSRGEVKIDMSTLKTHTFGDPGKDDGQTEHALTWLEIDKVTPEVKEKSRWATYAIRSVDGLSAPDASKIAAEKVGDDEVRKVTLTAHGELFLHGHKVNRDASLEVTFHYPAGAASDSKPTSVDVATKAPLHIILAEHDIKPRDNIGALVQGGFNLVQKQKVAEFADVSFDLHATPAS